MAKRRTAERALGFGDHVRKGELLAVVGPTATGKSDLAVELALRLDGEGAPSPRKNYFLHTDTRLRLQ